MHLKLFHFSMWLLFLPRRYAKARSLLSPGVRLSVTFVYCTQMAEDIVKRLPRHGSTIILYFCPQALVPNSTGITHTAGSVVGNICDSLLKSPFISETVYTR